MGRWLVGGNRYEVGGKYCLGHLIPNDVLRYRYLRSFLH